MADETPKPEPTKSERRTFWEEDMPIEMIIIFVAMALFLFAAWYRDHGAKLQ